MSFGLQQQIKNNASDIRSYVTDLYDWEEEMDKKEKNYLNKKPQSQLPKVRQQENPNIQQTNNEQVNSVYKRDKNTIKDYYKAWDQFDIDKEIEVLEEKEKEEELSKVENPYQNMTTTKSKAAPRAQIKILNMRQQVTDINSLKDKANLHYQSLEFKKALELYTDCLEKMEQQGIQTPDEQILYVTLLSNRAITQIKLQEYAKAEKDCDLALEKDPNHMKSYLRRGNARKKLQKLKASLQDFEKVLKLDQNNAEAKKELQIVQHLLKEKKQKALKELVLDNRVEGDYIRINIKDKDNNLPEQKETQQNNNKQEIQEQKERQNNEIQITDQNVQEMHNKFFQEKEELNEQSELSFAYNCLKNIDGKIHKKNNYEDQNQENIQQTVETKKKQKKVTFSNKNEYQILNEIDLTADLNKENVQKAPPKKVLKVNAQQRIEKAIETCKQKYQENIIEKKQDIQSSSQFLQEWNNIKQNHEVGFKYLQSLNTDVIPTVFKEGLEITIIVQIINCFFKDYNMEKGQIAKSYLIQLPKLKRFKISIMCMTKNEKQTLNSLFQNLLNDKILEKQEMEDLKKQYCV